MNRVTFITQDSFTGLQRSLAPPTVLLADEVIPAGKRQGHAAFAIPALNLAPLPRTLSGAAGIQRPQFHERFAQKITTEKSPL